MNKELIDNICQVLGVKEHPARPIVQALINKYQQEKNEQAFNKWMAFISHQKKLHEAGLVCGQNLLIPWSKVPELLENLKGNATNVPKFYNNSYPKEE